MASSSHGDGQTMASGKLDRAGNVIIRLTAHDECRPPIRSWVPDVHPARFVVCVARGRNQSALKAKPKFSYDLRINIDSGYTGTVCKQKAPGLELWRWAAPRSGTRHPPKQGRRRGRTFW